jgi:hypothetical protein
MNSRIEDEIHCPCAICHQKPIVEEEKIQLVNQLLNTDDDH